MEWLGLLLWLLCDFHMHVLEISLAGLIRNSREQIVFFAVCVNECQDTIKLAIPNLVEFSDTTAETTMLLNCFF